MNKASVSPASPAGRKVSAGRIAPSFQTEPSPRMVVARARSSGKRITCYTRRNGRVMGAVSATAQAQATALLASLAGAVPEAAEFTEKFAKLENRLALVGGV
jgi:hypothetical protein